ncbi:ferritin-like domain-containing protein [Earliella scabrosa]|nr:ferritin-like domain-containing protein [Earliella scabrosa]
MPSFASLLALAAPMIVLGAPAPIKRDTATNLLVLKFADVLEQFESTFYQQALAKFKPEDFTVAGFVSPQIPVEQFVQIQADEAAHATALEATIQSLGDTPITNCNFDFGGALNDVKTMAATARVVENLGVAAYLGAAPLLDDPVLLVAAGSILTTEARHQTILNVLNSGTSIPQAFDIAFLPNEVLAIAGAFISGCDLGVPANTPLSVTNTDVVRPGTLLKFESPAINGSVPESLFCQMLVGGMPTSLPLPLDQCVVPEGIEGPVALFVTADMQPLNNNVRDRANQAVLAGPTMAFIDTQKQLLSQLALAASGSGNNSANDGTTTATITPPEASSIIASASAAATATASGTDGAAAASPTDGSAAAPASPTSPAGNAAAAPAESDKTVVEAPGTRNLFTGPSMDGKITVNGWMPDQPLLEASSA